VSKSKDKGTAAETAVVRYLQNWWPAAERRALSGNEDKGDVAGIPGVCIEVKAAQRLELAAWRRETWAEMGNAGATHCILVVKRPRKPVWQWDAYVPNVLLPFDFDGDDESEAECWARMDLRMAAVITEAVIRDLSSRFSPS
jgi:Holliday junction resolvase